MSLRLPVDPEKISGEPEPRVVDSQQGALRADIRSLDPGRFLGRPDDDAA